MGRTLTIAICTGMMCFALAGCGDDAPQAGDGVAPPPGERTPPPTRTPSTGQPPSGGIGVDDTAPPPSGP